LVKVLDAGGKYGTVVNGVKVPTKPEPENFIHNIPMSEEQRRSLEVILTSDVNELRLGRHNASFWYVISLLVGAVRTIN
jgi:pSer/pThr/pTyr-binding forkhead associated (FHA) protein